MDNDLDFEYEDDFEYENSEDHSDDEEIRREMELDNIKSSLESNSTAAMTQLRALATNHTSPISIEAALELFRMSKTTEAFLMLSETIAKAPATVEDYARSAPFDEATRLLEQDGDLSAAQLIDIFVSVVNILRAIVGKRVFMKAALKLSSLYMDLGDYNNAWNVLDEFIETAIESMNDISAPLYKFEAIILRVKICAAVRPIRRAGLRSLLIEASKIPQASRSLAGLVVLQETEGLLMVEEEQLSQAKKLLSESYKGFSDSGGVIQEPRASMRVAVMLILASTASGVGDFDPSLDFPLIVGASDSEPALILPLQIASTFRLKDSQAFASHLRDLQSYFERTNWSLGQRSMLEILKTSFMAFKMTETLRHYSRIRWTTLKQKVGGTGLEVNDRDFYLPYLDGHIPGCIKRNLADDSIDSISFAMEDWRGCPSEFKSVIPLPKRYQEHATREAQSQTEDKILSKWKDGSSLARSNIAPSDDWLTRKNVHTLLGDALESHWRNTSHLSKSY